MLLSAVAGLAGLVMVPSASATFHLMKVSEVNASGGADFVELQMWTAGQNFVHNHSIFVYEGTGLLQHTYSMDHDLANGADQTRILIGNSNVAGTFGVTPDFVDPDLDLATYAGGGAVCFSDAEPSDCVAWGDFEEGAGFPDPLAASSEVAPGGLPLVGQSASRNITRGCPTLLEPAADDTGASSADFVLGTPTPQNSSMTPAEKPCSPPGGPGGGGPGGQQRARKKCKKKLRKRAAAAKKKCKKRKKAKKKSRKAGLR